MATLERKPTVGSWVLLEMWSPSLEHTLSYTQYVFKKKKYKTNPTKPKPNAPLYFLLWLLQKVCLLKWQQ